MMQTPQPEALFRAIASTLRANRDVAALMPAPAGDAYVQALDDLAHGLVDIGRTAIADFSEADFLQACGVDLDDLQACEEDPR